MRRDPVPVLWLCGPSGVGKSTVGFELFEQLSGDGTATAYVDLDQLGLFFPPPADDPGNDRAKAHNLGGVWAGFRAAGAQCLVVSGIVDDAAEVRRHAGMLPGTALTVCRLRVGDDELRARIARRGSLLHLTELSVRNAAELDRTGFADMVVDTAGRSVTQVVARLREADWPGRVPPRTVSPLPLREAGGPSLVPPEAVSPLPLHEAGSPGRAPQVVSPLPLREAGWPGPMPARTVAPVPPAGAARERTVPVLWVCGPPAVGKSTVGFEVFLRIRGDGVPVAYVDLAQLGFCRPVPDRHALTVHQLGRVWEGLRAAGARCLVVSGEAGDPGIVARYTAAIPSAAWTVCRLRAGPETLAGRVLLRGRGCGPQIMGDRLRGRPEPELRRRAVEAARIAAALDRSGVGDLHVDTDGRTVGEVADLVRAGATASRPWGAGRR